MTSPWPRCSFVADAAGDPREGSAPPADRWFLVEHPGPWGRLAYAQSGVDAGAVRAMTAWAENQGGRVLLVRRPGRATPATGPRRWFRVDSRPGHEEIRTGTVDTDAALAVAVVAPGELWDGPLHLVCTHGRHDTCCAVRGRPLAATLAGNGRTWECSHIGGCRFAPALVLLPHGYALGGVPPLEAAGVVEAYRDGVLDPRYVRGRSSLLPAVQAAQHHARLALDATGVDALRLLSAEAEPDGVGWRVQFADPDCTVLMHERRLPTGRPLTCAATAPGWIRVFDAVDVLPGRQRGGSADVQRQ